jgi:hypothetical protein
VSRSAGPLRSDLLLLGVPLLLALAPHAGPRLAGSLLLALFLPGYALLRCTGRPAGWVSIPDLLRCGAFSLLLTPVALRLAGSFLPWSRGMAVGVPALVSAALLAGAALRGPPAGARVAERVPGGHLALLALTAGLLVPTLVIGEAPGGGETRVKGWDLNNHLAIAEGIAGGGLPPVNPFLRSDRPLYYHTFFHLLVASLLTGSGITVHTYAVLALICVLAALVFLEAFRGCIRDLTGDARAALLALPLVSLAGGFDVFPALAKAVGENSPGMAHLLADHWNPDGWVSNRGMSVPTFFATFYWAPHAVCAIAALLCVLRLLRREDAGWGEALAAGAGIAAMAGYNGYVALGGAVTLAGLSMGDLARSGRDPVRRRILLRGLLAAAAGIALGYPVLRLYLGGVGGVPKFRWAAPSLLAPVQILLEFGPALLLGLAGIAALRRRRAPWTGWGPFLWMGALCLPPLVLVASTGENNDLAMRGSMLVWVSLAALSGAVLDDLFPPRGGPSRTTGWKRPAAIAALGLGIASVAWFAAGAALAKPALPSDAVAAGRWLRTHAPPGLLVQASPLRTSPEIVYLGGRPAALSDTWAARLFYSDPADFAGNRAAITRALGAGDPGIACPILRGLGIAYLVVGPPETVSFPILARDPPWGCLVPAAVRGAYRIYRITDTTPPGVK